MKKILTWVIPLLLVLVILIYLTMTPIGALRVAVLIHGHPIKAMTLQISNDPYRMHLEENQFGFTLEDPPYERDTDAYLYNWVVTRYGPFYIASYYGWG